MERVLQEIALAPMEQQPFMPALSVQQAVERFNTVVDFVRTVMREGIDYGRIPGTDKPTLLKPGAEKLCTLFGLASRFELIRAVEDWNGTQGNGEPFFYYLYRCQLWRDDRIIAEGDGSCNSFEQKYRYREAQRRCPACGQAAIIKGKEEYGGGWLCFRKKNGCGAKFADDDAEITSQPVGRVPNENIADQVNTIQKMAQKRSLIAAALLAVNGSEFFTQDGEDRIITLDASEPRDSAVLSSTPVADERYQERLKADLLEECARLCRQLKAAQHPSFTDKAAIVRHLQETCERKGWDIEAETLKSFSDLSAVYLHEYIAILRNELQR